MQSVLKFLKRKKEYAGYIQQKLRWNILIFSTMTFSPLISLHAATLIDQSQHLEENRLSRVMILGIVQTVKLSAAYAVVLF